MRGLNLPNLITLGRIGLALVVGPLLLVEGFGPRLAAFVVFLVAALSDLWDGHLARTRKLITDLGKLLDPLADKLLLAATFVPLYLLSHGAEPRYGFPWPGGRFPLWIVLVIFGREAFITAFRSWSARRGLVIAAGQSGKYKAVCQNIFIGAAILWYAFHDLAIDKGWSGGFWAGWEKFHYGFTVVVLAAAVLLTVYSLAVYMVEYRALGPAGRRGAPS
ncbi:MAG: pgsA [Gemmatimonadetes bacterium]|nr:pgsA [Gemmatimonadota bacterium]